MHATTAAKAALKGCVTAAVIVVCAAQAFRPAVVFRVAQGFRPVVVAAQDVRPSFSEWLAGVRSEAIARGVKAEIVDEALEGVDDAGRPVAFVARRRLVHERRRT